MDSCEWKLTDGELAEIKEKRIAELTAEVREFKAAESLLCEKIERIESTNQRLRDAGVKLVKAARFTMGQDFGSGAMLTTLCRLSEVCYAFEKGDVDND